MGGYRHIDVDYDKGTGTDRKLWSMVNKGPYLAVQIGWRTRAQTFCAIERRRHEPDRDFSFVTLTTVGYGDATPVRAAARSLALTEALTGQLYPAILLARLVSLTTASPSSSPVAAGTGPKRGTP